MSPVILVRTGLIFQAPEWGPDPGGSVRFKRSGGGEGGGGRKGAPAPGAGVGRGRCAAPASEGALFFAPSLTSKLNQDCSATLPVDVYVG